MAVAREPDAAAEVALLLAVARERREDAFRELYGRYERRLYGLGLRVLGDTGLAEELVQETSLRVWRTAERFDPERGSVSAFIFTIARRLAVDLWRRPSSRPFLPEAEVDPRDEDDFDKVLVSLSVRDALDSLPDPQRQVLELAYRSDLTQDEIASRLGVPLGTVKSRTYHALRAFKLAFEERQA
ncbi:MAG: sigma-70 family RNA polymerase sigma factor [Candidatus Dormibacteraeota bacterium]|nr:sigma-70 family RNA polymerase sigma factor [Candidatus Dormibacteraeota bacterium]